MFVLYCLRLGIEFSRLMAHYKCILSLLLLLLLLSYLFEYAFHNKDMLYTLLKSKPNYLNNT